MLTWAATRTPAHVDLIKRWLCRNDLFFLLVFVCRRFDMNHDWIFDRCEEVFLNPNGNLDLWAREHYKSTIITFGMSILDILASHGKDPEPRYGGREVTIGILSFNKPTARSFLKQIKTELETNQDLQALFPEILYAEPRRQARRWSEDGGLIVQRTTNPKEATVEGHGLVDGQPTGMHFFIRVYDDVVVRESVQTPEQIIKTTSAWELSDNLGTAGGWERYAGTRYHLFDTYATMAERGIPTRVHACTSDGSEDFTKAVLKDPSELADKRRKQGPYTFGAQMLLNPTADRAQGFDIRWLDNQYYPNMDRATAQTLNRYIIVDPASAKKKTSDYTSIWVMGVDASENWIILDGVRDRLNLVERNRQLVRLHRKWRPLEVGYEEYGLQADIEHHRYIMDQTNYRYTILPLGGTMAKADRIKRLVPMFEGGRIFLPLRGITFRDSEQREVDLIARFIEDEYTAFPVTAHDDMLDCLSRMHDMPLTYPMAHDEDSETPEWLLEHYAQNAGGSFMTR